MKRRRRISIPSIPFLASIGSSNTNTMCKHAVDVENMDDGLLLLLFLNFTVTSHRFCKLQADCVCKELPLGIY